MGGTEGFKRFRREGKLRFRGNYEVWAPCPSLIVRARVKDEHTRDSMKIRLNLAKFAILQDEGVKIGRVTAPTYSVQNEKVEIFNVIMEIKKSFG